jgi:hypothetical protein
MATDIGIALRILVPDRLRRDHLRHRSLGPVPQPEGWQGPLLRLRRIWSCFGRLQCGGLLDPRTRAVGTGLPQPDNPQQHRRHVLRHRHDRAFRPLSSRSENRAPHQWPDRNLRPVDRSDPLADFLRCRARHHGLSRHPVRDDRDRRSHRRAICGDAARSCGPPRAHLARRQRHLGRRRLRPAGRGAVAHGIERRPAAGL